jgi:hypothetical protein
MAGVAVIGSIEPKPIAHLPRTTHWSSLFVAPHGVAAPELPVVVMVNGKSHVVSPDNVEQVVVLTRAIGIPVLGRNSASWATP